MTTTAPSDRAHRRAERRIRAAGGIGPDPRRLCGLRFPARTARFPLDPCDVTPPHGDALLPRRARATAARLHVRARHGWR